MIATGVGLKEILNALCLIIEEQRAGTLASVLLLNADGVAFGLPCRTQSPQRMGTANGECAIGPCAGSCGYCGYWGSRVIVFDIATDPLWDMPEHRTSALKHGLRASWVKIRTFFHRKSPWNFLHVLSRNAKSNPQDLGVIDLATDLVRIAIERDRSEGALRASEQVARGQVEALTYSLDVLATAPAPEGSLDKCWAQLGAF